MHIEDEKLLAYLDGELGPLDSWRVARHLRGCWDCRCRAKDMEGQIYALREAVRSAPFPADLVAQARLRFEAWERTSGVAFRRPTRWPAGVAAAVAAMALFAAGWRLWRGLGSAAEPRALLAEAERVETGEAGGGVVLRRLLEVEVRAVSGSSKGEVEVFAEPGGPRCAMRWRDKAGNLRHAYWRPDQTRRLRYEEGRWMRLGHAAVVPLLVRLGAARLEAAELERVIVEWIFSHEWHPISLAGEVREFANQDGVRLRARQTAEAGERFFLIEILGKVGGRLARIVLVLDGATRRPRIQMICLQEGGRVAEIRLVAARSEIVPVTHAPRSWFVPEVELGRRRPWPTRRTAAPAPLPEAVSEAELLAAEVEALQALHEERICLREPVEVRRAGAVVEVAGLVSRQEIKQELMARLASLELAGVAVLRLKTVQEALWEGGGVAEQVSSAAAISPIRVQARPRTADDWLLAHFSKEGALPSDELGRRVADFCNRAVSLAEAALSDAWALRRLQQQFPAERAARLDAKSLRVLERLARDHLTELRVELETANMLWGRLLEEPAETGLIVASEASWEGLSGPLFAAVSQYHALVHSLLADADGPSAPVTISLARLATSLRGAIRTAETFERGPLLATVPPLAKQSR